jgi:uncharacterized integral membrane protein
MSRRRRSRNSALDTLKNFRVPGRLITWGSIILCIFILGGGFYNLLSDQVYTVIPYQGGYLTLHPYLSEQTVYESVFVMLANASIFVGLWLSYKSTQVSYDRVKANRFIMLGIGFTVAGLAGNHLILEMKRAIFG